MRESFCTLLSSNLANFRFNRSFVELSVTLHVFSIIAWVGCPNISRRYSSIGSTICTELRRICWIGAVFSAMRWPNQNISKLVSSLSLGARQVKTMIVPTIQSNFDSFNNEVLFTYMNYCFIIDGPQGLVNHVCLVVLPCSHDYYRKLLLPNWATPSLRHQSKL